MRLLLAAPLALAAALLDEETVRGVRWWRSSREGVLWDLEAYRLILERAAREGRRFRILRG